jgi:TonB-dependent starch-binding outer membrane protein SusC
VQVTTTEGTPGAEIQIAVRGGNSISQDNRPLYIVDGVQVENALSLISPQEIQTIDVLKDAASTSIYGARGANGVVLITTKSGRTATKPQLTYSAYAGVRRIAKQLDVMSPYDFVNYQYEIYNGNDNDRTTFINRYGRYSDLDLYQGSPATNWQTELFGRNAFNHTQVLGLTGGTKKTSYNITLNHADENGIMLNSGFARTLASVKVDHKFTNQLKVGISSRYSRQSVEGVGTSSTGSQSLNRLRNAVRYKPYNFGEDAEFDDSDLTEALQSNVASPLVLAENELKTSNKNDLNLTGYVNYDFLKGFTFRSTLGYTDQNRDGEAFFNSPSIETRRGNERNLPVIDLNDAEGYTLNNSNTLSYKTTFLKRHDVNFLLGQESFMSKSDGWARRVRWFPAGTSSSDAINNPDLAVPPSGETQTATDLEFEKSTLLSYFGRANYSFLGKYVATLSMRYDGSSKFNTGNRYKAFPSASLAWRISEEPFMKGTDSWLSNLKLRASYGTAGNNRIRDDLFVTTFETNNNGYAFDNNVTPALTPRALANSQLEWEVTTSRNLGLDVAFLNNRFNASVDLYSNNTDDLLLEARIPSHSGWTTQIQNTGKTRNKGIELQLAANLIKKTNFNWTANFNLSSNRNKIVSLGIDPTGQPLKSFLASSGWMSVGFTEDFLVEVGQPIGQFYGFVTDGRYEIDDFNVTNNNGVYSYVLKPGIANSYNLIGNRNPQPGDLKLQKQSPVDPSDPGSYLITAADRKVLGNAQPKFIGGLNQQFTYKGFDMSVYMNWSVGNKVYNANKIEFTSQYNNKDNNLLNEMSGRWRSYENGVAVTDPEKLRAMNANTSMWNPLTSAYFLHSYAIEDGSFLRLNNLTLGYTLPASLIKRTKLVSNLRVYATANNLWTITGYSGYDPEANTRRRTPLTPGVDYAAYPRSRYILAGLNVTF